MTRGPVAKRGCVKCPLAAHGCPRQPVRGIGPENPRIIVLAEGPGKEEVHRGEPLVGPTGQLFMRALERVGLKREEVWLGNVTLCQPQRGVNKEKVMPHAVSHCHSRVLKELRALPNAPILLLGKWAAQAFLGDKFSITELAGSYHEVEIKGLEGVRRIIPTLHPAHILRGGNGEESSSTGDSGAHTVDLLVYNLIYDVAKAKSLADGEAIKFTDDIYWEASRPERAERLIEKICKAARKAGCVAIDTETRDVDEEECESCLNCHGHDALQSYHAKLTAIGLATEKYAVSVAWPFLTDSALDQISALLRDETVSKVFHNRTYDMVVLKRNGFEVRGPVECTLLGHHNAFPGLAHKLQRVATQFFAIGPWKSEFRHGRGAVSELLRYNARDVLVTARLKPKIQVCIKRSEAEKTYEMDLRMARIAERMTQEGIPIDMKVNRLFEKYLSNYAASRFKKLAANLDDPGVKERFLDYFAVERAKQIRKDDPTEFIERHAIRMQEAQDNFEFNLNSKGQVSALIMATGVRLSSVTATGLISTKKDILESLGTHPVVRELLEFRSADKLLGTFVRPFPWMLDRVKRIHVVWDVNKITGRWGSKPNFQNFSKGDHPKKTLEEWWALPNDERLMPNLRAQVVAKEDNILVSGDFAQLEARIIALMSGDAYLCKAFNDKLDIHTEFAKEIFPGFGDMPPGDARTRKRDVVKTCEYAYLYGAAIATVWKGLTKEGFDVPIQVVSKMFKTFATRMPGVTVFHQRLFNDVLRKGCVKSFLLGRRREFPLGNADPSTVLNFPVQSSGADIIDTGLDRFDRLDLPCKYLVQGHDSFMVECREDDAEEIEKQMKECFTQTYTLNGVTITFPFETKIGKSWDRV